MVAAPGRDCTPSLYLSRDYGDGIRNARRSGLVARLRPGAWIEPMGDRVPWEQRERTEVLRCHALVRQLRSDHVFSHSTAALLHGCRLWRVEAHAHVIQRWSSSRALSADVRRHRLPLSADDIVQIGPLRVTSLERTLVDCARFMHPRDATVIVDSGLALSSAPDRWDREASDARVEAARRRLLQRLEPLGGRRGVRRAHAVIARATPYAESAPESVLRWVAESAGLPSPISQLRIDTRRGVYFADLGWRVERDDGSTYLVIVEFDGRVKYGDDPRAAADALVAEKVREDAVREARDVVVRRVVSADLRDLDRLRGRLLSAFPPRVRQEAAPVPHLMGVPRR